MPYTSALYSSTSSQVILPFSHFQYTGCLQIQPNKFPGDFQDTFNKFPVDMFTLITDYWSSYKNTTYKNTITDYVLHLLHF